MKKQSVLKSHDELIKNIVTSFHPSRAKGGWPLKVINATLDVRLIAEKVEASPDNTVYRADLRKGYIDLQGLVEEYCQENSDLNGPNITAMIDRSLKEMGG